MSTRNQIQLRNQYSVSQLTANLKEQILSGETDPLRAYIQLNGIAKAARDVMDDRDVKDAALNEYAKYGEKIVTLGDCKAEQSEVGVKYDYSVCRDSVLEDMQKTYEALAAYIKERQDFLKRVPVSGVADPETGEVIYPPAKSSKTSLKITFKK